MTDERSVYARVQFALEASHWGWNELIFDELDTEAAELAKVTIATLIATTAGEIDYLQSTLEGEGPARVATVIAFTPHRIVIAEVHQRGEAPSTAVFPRRAVQRLQVGRVRSDFRENRPGLLGVEFSVDLEGREAPVDLVVESRHLLSGTVAGAQQSLLRLLESLLADLDSR